MLTADDYVQSFHQNGFPATQVFERAGPIADPMYHNSGASSISNYTHIFTDIDIVLCSYTGDLSDRDGYDFDQIKSIAKVQVRIRSACICSRGILLRSWV